MEMANGIATGQDSGLSNSGLTSGQGSTSSNAEPVHQPAESSHAQERSFSQAEVNEIVKRAKNDARRVVNEQPDYARQKFGSMQTDSAPYAGADPDHVKRIVADTMQQMRDQWTTESQQRFESEQANKIINTFWGKVNPAKEKYADFEKVTTQMGLQSFPHTVQLLAEYVDNAGDVLYALGKDMGKLATIESWCERYPQVAISEVQKLAQSIKDNDQANKVRIPNEPLSQLQPKNVGLGNGNAASVKDWRARFKASR